jgi:hypothetical protein
MIECLKKVVNLIERGRYRSAAKSLIEGFVWEDTPQGFQFWDRIHNVLSCR